MSFDVNPLEIIRRAWTMKWARPFVVVDVLLWTFGLSFLAIHYADDGWGPLPLYPELLDWKYFGWTVLGYIVVTGCLTAVLVFFAAISNTVPPELKEERSSESSSLDQVPRLIALGGAVLFIVLGVQSRQFWLFAVAFFMLALSGVPILNFLLKGKSKTKK